MDKKRSIRLLICLLALTVPLVTVFVPSVFADSFYLTKTSTYCGYTSKFDSSYTTAHDASTGSASAGPIYFSVGQTYGASIYTIRRGFVFFDTATIPDTATINNATLSLYVYSDLSTADFNVTVQRSGNPDYPHNPLQSGDYDEANYHTDGGSRNTSDSMSESAYWNITLNEDGLDFIQVDGTTKLVLRSSKDISSTSPTGDAEAVLFGSYDYYPPQLIIGFTLDAEYYEYTFYGPFDEETGLALEETVDVTAYNVEGVAPENFTLDEADTFYSYYLIQYFHFRFEDNSTREYWVDPSESNSSTIYVFWGDTTTYTINFLDTTGILSTYPYVTIMRYVNGTLYTVEKRKADAYDSILTNLINGRTYQIYLGNEDVTYVFGDLTMTSLTTVQLTLKGADFPKESLLQRYVYMYTTRLSNGTYIYIHYLDSSEETYNVSVVIYESDMTEVYSYIYYNNSFILAYPTENTTHYLVTATIFHQTYGEMDYKQFLVGAVNPVLFDLSFLGDWGFDSYMLLPSLLVLCVAGAFSKVNAYVGCILMVITASVLSYLRWFPVPAGLLVAAFFLAVLMGLLYMKRGVRQH